MENQIFLNNIQALIRMHRSGCLGGESMPEDILLPIIEPKDLLNVLTLGMCLNYQRNSYSLWKAIAKTYEDKDCKWIFEPMYIVDRDIKEIRDILLKYKVALQANKHPLIWKGVAKGIYKSSKEKTVSGMLKEANNDIAILKHIIQKERKREFPYLSGPKIFNYWLYVLEVYGSVSWKSRELITIAPDTHILKATVELGLCTNEILRGTAEDRNTAAMAWEEKLKQSGLAPIDIHTPLWLWSRAGFPEIIIKNS
ncbi:hypothetical protein [Paenibacillus campi]|uniref:hypothetical protein n=1 Tax=Paenibacillus campi TaxID=3106031 RepID=UPI002AFF7BBA|nr:hypothetical protein [Paenibacillus sp. SGZ-1014]